MLSIDPTPLQNRKNLLAFSAGVDSSALFFTLLQYKIKFDIAIVNYGTRESSDKEVRHAKALARKHKLFCHYIDAPKFHSHFEQQARAFRYGFFESLIVVEGYDTLLTAHQLNDQLEWLLMRLCKGAGSSELLGLEPVSQREGYRLIRPLLDYPKAALLHYLESHHYPYFIDASNSEMKYERNQFREAFSDPLMREYEAGIRRSIAYLREDKKVLESGFELLYKEGSLRIIRLHRPSAKVRAVDTTLKTLGYLLSGAQRKAMSTVDSLVIGGKWAIEMQKDLLSISPYVTSSMPKHFKEQCRVAKIPPKIRPYCFKEGIDVNQIPSR